MTALNTAVSDERRHTSAANEVFAFGFDVDSEIQGFMLLGFRNDAPQGVVVAALTRAGEPYLYVHDTCDRVGRDVVGLRGSGVWADATCNAPLDGWTIGLEAFALGVQDASEAVADGVGDRVGLGFDLDFERIEGTQVRDEPPAADTSEPGDGWYCYQASAHGELLIGDDRSGVETTSIDAVGMIEHRWGSAAWVAAFSNCERISDRSPTDVVGSSAQQILFRLWEPTPWYRLVRKN